jgi:uncharacterized protein (TIGR02145 family)
MIKYFFSIVFMLWVFFSAFGQQYGSFKDARDGKVYKTVKIGNQEWMAENLNTDRFRNGDKIPEARSLEEWDSASSKKHPFWCYFDNDPDNGKKYGKLYNWYAVNDKRGLAPKGWHIPSDAEWTILINFLGGKKVVGKKLKSTTGWERYIMGSYKSGNGANSSGFTGLPGGYINYYQLNYVFSDESGAWWSSSEHDKGWLESGGTFFINIWGNEVNLYNQLKELGNSVRCIRD